MHKQFTTTQVFEDQVKFSLRLEGVDEVHDKGVLHSLQDIAFGFKGQLISKWTFGVFKSSQKMNDFFKGFLP